MGYSTLKAALDAVVRTNGNQQITGANLNGVMTTILQGVDVMDRANPADTSGLNKVVLQKDMTFAEQVTGQNTIFEIRDSFNLGGESVSIPANSILLFNGGNVKNGVLSGNNTSIIGGDYQLFDGITFSGTWKGDINACWVGAKQNDNSFDNSAILQAWFDNYCEYFPGIVFPCSVYYFSSAVVLSTDKRNKHIYGDGSTFNVNISANDAVFITLNVGEAFSLRDVKIQNVRTTGAYNISKTTALHLIRTHQFGIQGVEIRNFDKGVWLTDVWYGNFYGKNSFWQNRIAIFLDVTSSQEVNTIDLHNIRVSGCDIDAAKTLYPQESGESETDWAMRYARCGVDVHCTTYGVKYSGMVIEGVDYGIRYNYRPRSTQATIDALIIIENCYFEGNTQNDIYIGKGYVINPNNLANYYVIAGGHVKIDSCLFHSTLDPHIYIKDCYTLITNCSPVKFVQDYQYARSMIDAGEEVSANMGAGSGMTIKRSEKLQFPDANGNVYPSTIRQTTGNIRNRNMASGLLNGTNALNINTSIFTSNGSGVARYIPTVQGLTDAPRVNVHFGIQPYEMDIMDNIYHVRIPSGNGSVRVGCNGSQYITCVYSFRNDGIEITEFMRRWKAGTAYEGYVNQVFPFKVRSVPAEGKLYMDNYQGVESLIGVGKKAIDDGFSFSTGYYMFVDALCYIFFAYSVPRFNSDLVQCGRAYNELGISGSSTAQYNKFRFICTDAQRANLRPRLNAVIYNTTSKQLQIYDGTQWVELTDPFKRYVYAESGASISARATAPDLPGQTYFNYATGITYRYALTSVDRYNGEWIGDIGQVSALDHPNGYDATSNPLDYATELTAGEMVRYNGALYKWDGTQFVAL